MPAGSSRAERLDPCALPVRFHDTDQSADERMRVVELHRERVVLRRAVAGIKMAVSLPVKAYLGVSIRIEPPSQTERGAVAIVLEHGDPALSLTLHRAHDPSDIVAGWHCWGRVLGLPLLLESAGELCDPFERGSCVRIDAPQARRRGAAALKARRPATPLRRRSNAVALSPVLHRGEREIIARN
jgi:Family of unknown function (DUF6101)